MSLHPEVADRWSRLFSTELDRPVRVQFGRARRNVVVVRANELGTVVRLNQRFAEAPDEVRDSLIVWMRSGKRARRASAILDAWVDELGRSLGPPRRRSVRIEPRGAVHDLAELAREVLAAEFEGELEADHVARVTWGRRGTRNGRGARRTLQLGSYDPERDLVRMHPVLDQEAVPRFFVRYVLFHEFLHALIDRTVEAANPRRRRRAHHPPEFQRREQAYADFERAMEWQRANLGALFRSARSGQPLRVARATRLGARVQRARSTVQGWLFPDALVD